MSAPTTLRVLAVGFAGIGTQDHQSDMYLPALAAHPGFRVSGVVGLDGDRPGAADAAAHAHGCVRHPDLATALTDPDVDVVSVAVPLADREAVLSDVIRAGKHVLADKPLAADTAAVDRIAQLAAEHGVVVVPAHHLRLQPAIRTAAAAVRAGRVGLPWNVQADLIVAGGDPAPGGELANLALYPIDIVHALLALPVRRVHARGGGTDPVVLLLDHDHGVTSTITCGRVGALPDIAPSAPVVHRYRVSGSHGVLLTDATKPAATVRAKAGRTQRWAAAGTVAALLDVFAAGVATGRAALGPAEARYTQQVVDAATESLRTGQPVEIEEST